MATQCTSRAYAEAAPCGGSLELLREVFDEISKVFVGTLVCTHCRAQYVDTRRRNQSRKAAPMAKRGRDGYPKAGAGRPRQQDLIEDRAIKPLEDAASEYAQMRDERMVLTESEATLKVNLLAMMKKHGKTVYHRGGVTITVVAEKEKVKVRVKKPAEAGEAVHTDANAGEQTAGGTVN